MVFQNYALYPHMTVYQNMAFSLKLRGMPEGRDRPSACARSPRILGLDRATSSASPASSPAASASASPSAAALVPPGRACSSSTSRSPTWTPSCASRCARSLKRLHHAIQSTMIYVTHDQVEAMTMGDRIVDHERRRDLPGRDAARHLRPARQPLRRRLHRQPADEFLRGQDRGRRGRTGRRPRRRPASSARPAGPRPVGRPAGRLRDPSRAHLAGRRPRTRFPTSPGPPPASP